MSDDLADLVARGRRVVDDNLYMTLGTADTDGTPWVSPVYFAHDGYRRLYWISSPDVQHSRNLAGRPRVSVVVFDSRVPIFMGEPVYMAGDATEVPPDEVAEGLAVYPGSRDPATQPMTPDQLRAPAPYRLYLVTVTEHWMLCPRTTGPCAIHGWAYDHRLAVTL